MKALILAVGSELLRPGRSETHSERITPVLESAGLEVESRRVVSDDPGEIARALVEAHGGAIHQRRSEVLGGACFAFTLPAVPADPRPRLPGRPAEAACPTAAPGAHPPAGGGEHDAASGSGHGTLTLSRPERASA